MTRKSQYFAILYQDTLLRFPDLFIKMTRTDYTNGIDTRDYKVRFKENNYGKKSIDYWNIWTGWQLYI